MEIFVRGLKVFWIELELFWNILWAGVKYQNTQVGIEGRWVSAEEFEVNTQLAPSSIVQGKF